MTTIAAAPRPGVPKEALYQTPDVAWPTLALFVAAAVLWGVALWAALAGLLHPALAIALQTVAAFMQFTVLHDGVHRSLLRAHPRLNDVVAGCAGVFLGVVGSVTAFRYAHFKHHRHTNEPGVDPDLWSGEGPRWSLPLRWATAELRYVVIILRDWSQIPRAQQMSIGATVGGIVAAYALCWVAGYGVEATLYWLIPSRLAVLWLAFAFNYLPHHPHDVVQAHNPYAATNARRGGEPVMKWLFLYQNYHVIHHLFPSVPFYRYLKIWQRREAEFKGLGTPVVSWWRLA